MTDKEYDVITGERTGLVLSRLGTEPRGVYSLSAARGGVTDLESTPSRGRQRAGSDTVIRERKSSQAPMHLPSRVLILLSPFNGRRPCLHISLLGRLRRSGEPGKVAHSLWLVPRTASIATGQARWTPAAFRSG